VIRVKNIIFFLIVPLALHLKASRASKLDSLVNLWNVSSALDTNRFALAINISQYYNENNNDSGLVYINDAIKSLMSLKLNSQILKLWNSRLLAAKAWSLRIAGRENEALKASWEAIRIAIQINDDKMASEFLNDLGVYFLDNAKHGLANTYFSLAYTLRKKVQDYGGMSISLNNLAFLLQQQGNIVKALDYYHESLRIREKYLNKKNDLDGLQNYATTLLNVSSIYLSQNDVTNAKEYCLRGQKAYEQVRNVRGIGQCLNTLGVIEQKRKNYDESLRYFRQGYIYHLEAGYKKGAANTLVNIGFIFHKKNQLDSALTYYIKGLALKDEMSDFLGRVHVYINISRVYWMQNNLQTALKFALKSHALALEQSNPENIRESSSLLYMIYKKMKQPTEALAMHELFIRMRDSIQNVATNKGVYKSEVNYEYDKKAFNDSLRALEEEMAIINKLEKEKSTRQMLFVGIILVGCFAFFAINRLRVISRQKKLIEEQKQIVENKQKEILDSILYAQRIQGVLMTNDKYIDKTLRRLNNS
jgi:tetratricopeptide (TPR) repeat protein